MAVVCGSKFSECVRFAVELIDVGVASRSIEKGVSSAMVLVKYRAHTRRMVVCGFLILMDIIC